MAKILIIEDEEKIARFVELELQHEGYETGKSGNGREGLELAESGGYDLILLDIMLPGLTGLEVLRRLRRTSPVPVILLTARDSVTDKVAGLDMGANDYITKPLSCPVLLARIRAALRTDAERNGGILACDGLELDRDAQVVRYRKERISLSPAEYRLLEVLMAHPGRIHTRTALLDMIQQEARDVTDRTIDVMLSHMRPKLGAWAEHIETARGIGYRLVP